MPETQVRQIISMDEFRRRALAARQHTGPEIIVGSIVIASTITAQVEEDPKNDRRLTFVFSTANENRNGWQLNPQGWKTENFLLNPVMLWVHYDGSGWGGDVGSHGLPFARAEKVWVDGDRTKVTCLWVDEGDITGEAGELCESVLRLYRKGYLNAVSAGWIPLDYEFVETEDGWKVMCKEQELVEISFVPVPAEPNALRQAASAGINLAPLRRWARSVLGEPRYVIHASGALSSEVRMRLQERFAEFYPGAKVLIIDEGAKLAPLDDLNAVRTMTLEEFDASVAKVVSAGGGSSNNPAIPAPPAVATKILSEEKVLETGTTAPIPSQTGTAGTPAAAPIDAPGERSILGTPEWRTRQLAAHRIRTN